MMSSSSSSLKFPLFRSGLRQVRGSTSSVSDIQHRRLRLQKKTVLRVQMNCEKCRIKTLRVVSEADGVSSVGFEGENKQNVVVIGDVDAAGLASRLRKKVGHTEIISVAPVSSDGEGIAYGIWHWLHKVG